MFKGVRTIITVNHSRLRCNAFNPLASLLHTEVTQCNGICEIKLNEPKTRNSLSMGMMESILAELKKNACDETVRAIVLSSSGAVWSAGHNLKELASDRGAAHQKEIFDKLSEIILCIHTVPVPVIAKVNGLAAAAGCQLVASCDIVVSSDKSSFSTPGANFGIFCSTPGVAIGRVMPRLKSSYMLLTGLPLSAHEAYTAGLVSVIATEAQLDAELHKVNDAIKGKSRAVIALGKQFYYKQLSMGISEAYRAGAEKMTENLALTDGKEGLKSFVEKRKPKWTHETV